MKAISITMILLATGCDRWSVCDDHAQWRLTPSSIVETAAAADDGSIVWPVNATGSYEISGTALVGPHVLRIDLDGHVVATAPAPAAVLRIATDVSGGTVIAWATTPATIVAYGPDLAQRWSVDVLGDTSRVRLDIGPQGEVAYLELVSDQYRLHYLAPDGTQRWLVMAGPLLQGADLRIADGGDVFLWRGGRQRFAAATGASVESIAVLAGGELELYDRDGTRASFANDSPTASVERSSTDGSLRWHRDLPVQYISSMVEGSDKNLVVLASYIDDMGEPRASIYRLDGASGAMLGRIETCSRDNVVAADPDSYTTGPWPLARYRF